MKEFLSNNGIKYGYLDISENLFNLKAFLKYRDLRPEFDEAKKKGDIGIPFIVVNNGEKVYLEKPENIDELK